MTARIRKPKVGKPALLPNREQEDRINRARMLDRLADVECQRGHIGAAEWLSHRAAELRENPQ